MRYYQMILSYMKPPYQITDTIMHLVVDISQKLGEINATHLYKPKTELRKKNRIKTIQSSLEIEGNTLTEEQITALLENKRVLAPKKDILEVQNAIQVYEQIHNFNPKKITDLEKAHKVLMNELIDNAGKLRLKNVGILKGSKIEHLAPSGDMVRGLMNNLFKYLKKDNEILLIKSCVFHYELEFIHPFTDGNGRMGRLWQTLILMEEYPIFVLPIESLIKENQTEYYDALGQSDNMGSSTPFIEFMLRIILQSLKELLNHPIKKLTTKDRITFFKSKIAEGLFTRKDYLQHFKNISQATASRDLKWATEQNILCKFGDKRNTKYQYTILK